MANEFMEPKSILTQRVQVESFESMCVGTVSLKYET